MREILFRGQTRKYGEKVKMNGEKLPGKWVYGGVFHQNGSGGSYSIIYSYDPIEKHTVYADTVGQYTGLTDKNGKKIFEGDIVKIREFFCAVKYDPDNASYMLFNKDGFKIEGFNTYTMRLLSVIGNIYDNPELLEGEQ